MTGAMLSQERLKSLLHYDSEMGVFTRLVSTSSNARVGDVAGCVCKSRGYVVIRIDGKTYYAHRLAWLYLHGTLPPDGLDHINRVKTDNRICNLRLATQVENGQNQSMRRNNTSGHIGVCWHKRTEKWEARIMLNRKPIHLGNFTDLAEALASRKAAEVKYHTFNQPRKSK